MELHDYERAAVRTTNPSLTDATRLMDAAAGLAEEAGEILGLVRKHLFVGHTLDAEHLRSELGDALWCLTMVAGAAGLSLEDVARANLAKLERRYPHGFSSEASQGRAQE
jgi:NTP pyrophosphatase (non-canonical NTP hydrolase)